MLCTCSAQGYDSHSCEGVHCTVQCTADPWQMLCTCCAQGYDCHSCEGEGVQLVWAEQVGVEGENQHHAYRDDNTSAIGA